MRRREKKKVEEFIYTLRQAHDEIKNQIEKNNIGVAQEILGDCQDCVAQLGELIETSESEECKVIPLL